MEQTEFYHLHGVRVCFYLLLNIVGFVPLFVITKSENDAQKVWAHTYEALLLTGVILPFFIEGFFSRRSVRTYHS